MPTPQQSNSPTRLPNSQCKSVLGMVGVSLPIDHCTRLVANNPDVVPVPDG